MNSDTNNDKAMLVNLVTMLATSAIQQMGAKDDQTAEGHQSNLQSAQMIIDMLDMIERKTKGNLDQDEERIIRDTLSSLKLAFVEATKQNKAEQAQSKDHTAAKKDDTAEKDDRPKSEPVADKPPEKPVDKPPETKTENPETKKSSGDEDHRKFHKTYG